jgi:hypothetical protein
MGIGRLQTVSTAVDALQSTPVLANTARAGGDAGILR